MNPQIELIAEDAEADFDGKPSDDAFMGLTVRGLNTGTIQRAARPCWGGIRSVDATALDPLIYPTSDGRIFLTSRVIQLLKWGLERELAEEGKDAEPRTAEG